MKQERILALFLLLLLTWEAGGCSEADAPFTPETKKPPTVSVVAVEEAVEEEPPREKEAEEPPVAEGVEQTNEPSEDDRPEDEEAVPSDEEKLTPEAPLQGVEKNPFEAPVVQDPPAVEKEPNRVLSLSEGETLWLQESLKIAGHYTPRDGLLGPDTEAKLEAFQREQQDLPFTGTLDEKTRYRLEAIRADRTPPAKGTLRVLVNKSYDLNAHDAPEVAKPEIRMLSDMRVAAVMVDDLERLFADAEAAGHQLALLSGYRTYAYQETLFRRAVQRDGFAAASQHTAVPGRSEHQTGLAVDLTSPEVGDGLTRRFAQTKAYQWLVDNSYRYGFFLRYPEGKTAITGYQFEPWHYRYIGDPAVAEALMRGGLTYEEWVAENPDYLK